MNLNDLSYSVDHLGKPRLVIDDQPLLGWAKENAIEPWKAQLHALRNEIVPLRYLKNFDALTLPEQIQLCAGRVLICGCGGLGGTLINLLARTGVGYLRLVDGDVFAPSNLNRQWLCDIRELDRSKAKVAEERVRSINPLIQVESYSEILTADNAEDLLRDVDLVLDALDNLQGRFVLGDAARRNGSPFLHAAVAGWWGQISTFLPGSGYDLRSIYGNLQARDGLEESMGVLGATAAIIGSLEAMEAIRILAGRRPVYAGRLLYFDGEGGTLEIVPL